MPTGGLTVNPPVEIPLGGVPTNTHEVALEELEFHVIIAEPPWLTVVGLIDRVGVGRVQEAFDGVTVLLEQFRVTEPTLPLVLPTRVFPPLLIRPYPPLQLGLVPHV